MGATLKLLALTICLNTFLYLGLSYGIYSENSQNKNPFTQDDIFSLFLEDDIAFKDNLDSYVDNLNNGTAYNTGASYQMTGNFSTAPDPASGAAIDPTQAGFSFLDPIRMIYAFIVTIWRIATVSLTVFLYGILNPFVAVIIGIPLFILNVATVILIIRGNTQ